MDVDPPARLDVWDYVTLSCFVILSTLIGVYHIFTARKSKVTKEFLVTSNELGLFPLIMSSVATFFSAIGMMGFPVEVYMNGLSFALICFPILISCYLGSHFYLPVFFNLNRNTIYEYLELRFCKSVRLCASILQTTQTVLYTAVVMYAPSLALSQVTGMHLWTSVLSIGAACILYTSMGGIKAVVWADVTQLVMMMGVLLIIIIKSAIDIGGFGVVWDRLAAGNRTQMFIWTSSPNSGYTFWTMFIANPVHILAIFTINQSLMQRCLSNSTLKRAQTSYLSTALVVTLGNVVYMTVGALLYAYYHNCDPKLAGKIGFRDQLIPLFGVDVLSFCKGFPGIFIAGIMCATLSTLSSMINSLTAITISDYVKAIKPDLSNETTMKLSKYLAVFYGVTCIALVALAENMGGIVKATFAIGGMVGGPMLTLFTIGMALPWVSSKGAIVGLFCSIVLPLWSMLGNMFCNPQVAHAPLNTLECSNFTNTNITDVFIPSEQSYLDNFYTIHPFWYTAWSLVVGATVSIIFTKFAGGQDALKADPDLFFPIVSKYLIKKKQLYTINLKQELDVKCEEEMKVIEPLLENDNKEDMK